MSFDKHKFFAENKPKLTKLDLPEFGSEVYATSQSVKIGLSIERDRASHNDLAYLVHLLVDESGNPLFDEGDYEDLKSMDHAVLTKAYKAISDLYLEDLTVDSIEAERKKSEASL